MAVGESLAAALAVAKTLRDLSNKIKDADAKNAIADLNLALADLKMQIVELQSENLDLAGQLKAKQDTGEYRKSMELREGVYWFKGTVPEGRHEGPYCPSCLDSKDALITADVRKGHFAAFGKYQCPSCKATFEGSN